MLIFDYRIIGNKLLATRKKAGLTQAELAEVAGLSDRTYADIERGNVNMRMETFLRICQALHITPDDILTEGKNSLAEKQSDILEQLNNCPSKEKETALDLLTVYLQSLEQ
ncbi:MAG: helix-turn-helix transcriptional regulator [Hominilimicola sp.]